MPEDLVPALGLSEERWRKVCKDETRRAKLTEVQASATAFRGILNAVSSLALSLSGDSLTKSRRSVNIVVALVAMEASRLGLAQLNLALEASGQSQVKYDERVEGDKELGGEKREKAESLKEMSAAIAEGMAEASKKRKRKFQKGNKEWKRPRVTFDHSTIREKRSRSEKAERPDGSKAPRK